MPLDSPVKGGNKISLQGRSIQLCLKLVNFQRFAEQR